MDEAEGRRNWTETIADMRLGTTHQLQVPDDMDELEELVRAARGKVDLVLQDPKLDATALGAVMVLVCELILRLRVSMAFDHRGHRFRITLDERHSRQANGVCC